MNDHEEGEEGAGTPGVAGEGLEEGVFGPEREEELSGGEDGGRGEVGGSCLEGHGPDGGGGGGEEGESGEERGRGVLGEAGPVAGELPAEPLESLRGGFILFGVERGGVGEEVERESSAGRALERGRGRRRRRDII